MAPPKETMSHDRFWVCRHRRRGWKSRGHGRAAIPHGSTLGQRWTVHKQGSQAMRFQWKWASKAQALFASHPLIACRPLITRRTVIICHLVIWGGVGVACGPAEGHRGLLGGHLDTICWSESSQRGFGSRIQRGWVRIQRGFRKD